MEKNVRDFCRFFLCIAMQFLFVSVYKEIKCLHL